MSARISVLILGLGRIGMGYDLHLDSRKYVYSHARAFANHPRFKLIAAVDPEATCRQAFEQVYGRPAYEDLETALSSHQPELVVIAVPTASHWEILQRVLSHTNPGVVLCEKPLSYDLEEATMMVGACADRDVQLYVNYMRRSDPGVIELKKRLVSGSIASPGKGVVWYSKGFLHNGSHYFNLLEFLLGEMKSAEIFDHGQSASETDPEPDVRVVFLRGTVVFLAAREEDFSHYTLELLTSNGRLRYEQGGRLIEWQTAQPNPLLDGYRVLSAEPQMIPSGMDRYQWHVAEQLAAAIDENDFHLCTGSAALATLESMHQIIKGYDN